MYNYPFSSFPYYKRYSANPNMYYNKSNFTPPVNITKQPYYTNNRYNNLNSNSKSLNNSKSKNSFNEKSSNSKNTNSKSFYGLSFLDNFFHQDDRDDDENYFDLFGLKLYNDDILLIGLIFFLYKEDVKDQYLFIALILLLLS